MREKLEIALVRNIAVEPGFPGYFRTVCFISRYKTKLRYDSVKPSCLKGISVRISTPTVKIDHQLYKINATQQQAGPHGAKSDKQRTTRQ